MKKIEIATKKLVFDQIINETEAKAININQILNFVQSDLAKRIRNATSIYKEKPFYINVEAGMLTENKLNENVLVQGIIDLYFVDEFGKMVLVDYKTDKVENVNELVEKYKVQLDLYKQALEEALNKKIDEIYIYSIYKNETINIDL